MVILDRLNKQHHMQFPLSLFFISVSDGQKATFSVYAAMSSPHFLYPVTDLSPHARLRHKFYEQQIASSASFTLHVTTKSAITKRSLSFPDSTIFATSEACKRSIPYPVKPLIVSYQCEHVRRSGHSRSMKFSYPIICLPVTITWGFLVSDLRTLSSSLTVAEAVLMTLPYFCFPQVGKRSSRTYISFSVLRCQ